MVLQPSDFRTYPKAVEAGTGDSFNSSFLEIHCLNFDRDCTVRVEIEYNTCTNNHCPFIYSSPTAAPSASPTISPVAAPTSSPHQAKTPLSCPAFESCAQVMEYCTLSSCIELRNGTGSYSCREGTNPCSGTLLFYEPSNSGTRSYSESILITLMIVIGLSFRF